MSNADLNHYRPLFRYQDDGFVGLQAQPAEEYTDCQNYLAQIEAGVNRLRTQNSDAQLLLPMNAEQMCDQSLMTQLLDRLLKWRFSWRNIVLLIRQLPPSVSAERFNQAAYKLHQCQLQIWLDAAVLPELALFDEMLLADVIYFDYQQRSTNKTHDQQVLKQLYDDGIDFVMVEPPAELLEQSLPYPPRLVLTSKH